MNESKAARGPMRETSGSVRHWADGRAPIGKGPEHHEKTAASNRPRGLLRG